MRKQYMTLAKEEIDLAGLTEPEKAFLGEAVKAYEAGEAYPNFVNRVNAPGSAALARGRWVTEKVARSPLYRVCQDLADRLGIVQGFLAVGKGATAGGTGSAESATPDFISSDEAASELGVTPEAIRKAIRAKRLPARRIGRTYVLERAAVAGYGVRAGRHAPPGKDGTGRARWRTALAGPSRQRIHRAR